MEKSAELPTLRTERELWLESVTIELDRAYLKHGRLQWGRHEFYAILKEEFDEVWDAIKADDPQEKVEEEIIQIMAVCLRYLETKDRYRQPRDAEKPSFIRKIMD